MSEVSVCRMNVGQAFVKWRLPFYWHAEKSLISGFLRYVFFFSSLFSLTDVN